MNPRARNTDPETSHLAAASMVGIAHRHEERILDALELFGPQTIHELSEATGLNHVSVARRMKELEQAHAAFRVFGVVRMSPNGRKCTVWRAAENEDFQS